MCEVLAEKLLRGARGLGDLTPRRSWACLRTFAADGMDDAEPVGFDPRVPDGALPGDWQQGPLGILPSAARFLAPIDDAWLSVST
jgi:hypothetical protein